MAIDILAQSVVASANVEQQIYKPSGVTAAISSIFVCNRGATDRTFQLGIDIGDANGGDMTTEEYIFFDTTVKANRTYVITTGICLGDGDSLNGEGSHTDITFTVFGETI